MIDMEKSLKRPGVFSFRGGQTAYFVAFVVHLEFILSAEILEVYLNGNPYDNTL